MKCLSQEKVNHTLACAIVAVQSKIQVRTGHIPIQHTFLPYKRSFTKLYSNSRIKSKNQPSFPRLICIGGIGEAILGRFFEALGIVLCRANVVLLSLLPEKQVVFTNTSRRVNVIVFIEHVTLTERQHLGA